MKKNIVCKVIISNLKNYNRYFKIKELLLLEYLVNGIFD